MASKELKKLSRQELLELLLEQGKQLDSYRVEVSQTQHEVLQSGNDLAAALMDLSQTEDSLQQSRKECARAQEELASLKVQMESRVEEAASARMELEASRSGFAKFNAELEVAHAEAAAAREELAAAYSELDAARAEAAAVREELAAAYGELDATRAELNAALMELETAYEELEGVNGQLAAASAKAASFRDFRPAAPTYQMDPSVPQRLSTLEAQLDALASAFSGPSFQSALGDARTQAEPASVSAAYNAVPDQAVPTSRFSRSYASASSDYIIDPPTKRESAFAQQSQMASGAASRAEQLKEARNILLDRMLSAKKSGWGKQK